MIPVKLFYVIIGLMFLQLSTPDRRITDGQELKSNKEYMVYIVNAPNSTIAYDAWLCGGVIVSPNYIVTSAACVTEVEYMYVIAGYNKYITVDKLNEDFCTRKMKKKIIFTCVPKTYNLEHDKIEKWSLIDIAVAKVESSFNFNDKTYEEICSYRPSSIKINYDKKYQEPGVDAMVLGWGHLTHWRKPGDKTNYNQETLKYAPTLILDKEKCKDAYKNYPKVHFIIDKYMICTNGSGNIDSEGIQILQNKPTSEGCRRALRSEYCNENKPRLKDMTRQGNIGTFDENYNSSRRFGICQNDHGGPLVTWVGSQEVLIGVASVFGVDNESKCMGPYLFTSTHCNGVFLDCVLSKHDNKSRLSICDSPPILRGFDSHETKISWIGHPAGPADNELS